MSQSKKKKKVVVASSESASKLQATKSSLTSSTDAAIGTPSDALFGKRNFTFMFIGIGLIALGMILMSGGSMPDHNTWDEDIIYSSRRTVLAPIVILAGLAIQVYAIFTKK